MVQPDGRDDRRRDDRDDDRRRDDRDDDQPLFKRRALAAERKHLEERLVSQTAALADAQATIAELREQVDKLRAAKITSDVHAAAPRYYTSIDPIKDIAIYVKVLDGNNFMVPLPRETARVGDVRQAMARRGNSAATESYFMYAGRCLSDKFLLKQFEGPEMTVFCMPFSSYTGPAPLEQAHTSWADVYNLFETLTERKPRFRSPLPPGVARPTL